MKNPLVILTGPTAAGKTKLSIALAKAVGGEIISADSVQVYKHMDIGSAKIKQEEMCGITHYLVDILEPVQDFSVVLFQQYAKQAIEQIRAKGKIPIMVGGTGFYIQSVLYDIDFQDSMADDSLRKELEETARQQGAEYLHHILEQCDPQAAAQIHANNMKRVIRAIEFYRQTGTKISEHNTIEREKQSAYNSFYFVLTDTRSRLYENIDKRVDSMIEKGLTDEVKKLIEMGCKRNSTAMQGLGYKEIYDYLSGECTLDEAVYRIKRDTRHFAKRQLTWFRREKEVIWVEKGSFKNAQELLMFLIEDYKKYIEANLI